MYKRQLYQAALVFLALTSSSPEAVSISLAFYGAATTLARALRAPRTLRDWGARVIVLAAVLQVASVDTDAARQLIREGMLATVELSLHVRTPCYKNSPFVGAICWMPGSRCSPP